MKLFVSIFVYTSDYIIRYFKNILNNNCSRRCVVIYYHNISKEKVSSFSRQLDEITRLSIPIRADYFGVLEDGRNYVSVTIDDAFQSTYENGFPELINRRIPFTVFIPTGYIGKLAGWINDRVSESKSLMVMDENEITKLKDNEYILFGSHSVTHPNLDLIDDKTALDEILCSKIQLEKIVNKEVALFSFPFGAYNERHIEMARKAGYARVFTTQYNNALFSPFEFVTGRVRVDPDDWLVEFRLKILGSYRWQPFASILKYRLANLFYNNSHKVI